MLFFVITTAFELEGCIRAGDQRNANITEVGGFNVASGGSKELENKLQFLLSHQLRSQLASTIELE